MRRGYFHQKSELISHQLSLAIDFFIKDVYVACFKAYTEKNFNIIFFQNAIISFPCLYKSAFIIVLRVHFNIVKQAPAKYNTGIL
jgi:hypothetical protein